MPEELPGTPGTGSERHHRELRLFLEEICCDIARFHRLGSDGLRPPDVRITQEARLGGPDLFADIKVEVPGHPPEFIEVKYGYPADRILAGTVRKFGRAAPAQLTGARLNLVVDTHRQPSWSAFEDHLRQQLQPAIELQVWDEPLLRRHVEERFGVTVDSLAESDILRVREALDQAKGRLAFGDEWRGQDVQNELMWHFGFWRLAELRERQGLRSRAILPPGTYRGVAVLLCDMCSFSGYVRDTRDDEVVRYCLGSFYSKTRSEILATGGMMYQFVGDEVIGFYGLPDRPSGYLQDALKCARTLVSIGDSISQKWQRCIDRVQPSRGVHIGMAIGDIQVVSLRPFGRAHLGAISDAVNMGARLLSQAGAGEIVVSNTFFQGLPEEEQAGFEALGPVDARNMGTINAWKLKV